MRPPVSSRQQIVRAGCGMLVATAIAPAAPGRPQRPRLATEAGTRKWMDVGNLAYAIRIDPQRPAYCPHSTYTATDPALTPVTFGINGTVPAGTAFVDTSADRPASPDNTLALTLNLSSCHTATGGTGAYPGGQVYLESYAIGTNYPTSGPAPGAQSRIGFTAAP